MVRPVNVNARVDHHIAAENEDSQDHSVCTTSQLIAPSHHWLVHAKLRKGSRLTRLTCPRTAHGQMGHGVGFASRRRSIEQGMGVWLEKLVFPVESEIEALAPEARVYPLLEGNKRIKDLN